KLYTEGRNRVVTAEEFRSLLRHSNPRFRRVLLFLRLTGARPGELCRLAWEDVDLDKSVAVLHNHKTKRKTGKPRVVYPAPVTVALLRYERRLWGQKGPVFRTKNGRPWTVQILRAMFVRVTERAGIGPDHQGEVLVPYSLRHTFASSAWSAGVTDR